jgi:membrane protein required for colicin V production
MEFIDIILLLIIGGFGLAGIWFGLIHTLGSLVGTLLGVYIASRYYEVLADWLQSIFGWVGNTPKVIVFIVAFLVINRLVGFGFWFLEKFFSIFTRLPFVRSLNRLLGLIFGISEGIITVGIVIYFIERFPLSLPYMSHLANSQIAPYTVGIATLLLPLIPEGLKILHSTVDYVEGKVVEIRTS